MKNWIKQIAASLAIILFTGNVLYGQDDLLELLNQREEPVTNYAIATFKNTRLISGHSIETNGKGVLQFLIGHRFGRLNSGWRELYGLDNSLIRLGFEYGITDEVNIGFGRSSYQKTFDGSVKWKMLRQKSGAKKFPFTATWVSAVYMLSNEWPEPDRVNYFSSRLTYHHAFLIARKFNDHISFQIMPTAVHRNLVGMEDDRNTVFSLGTGASFRLTSSMRFNLEHYYLEQNQIKSLLGGEEVRNSFSVGIDLETGGHIFQLFFSTSRGMTEKYLIGETTGDLMNGDIHFGFNVSRVFTVSKPKEFRK